MDEFKLVFLTKIRVFFNGVLKKDQEQISRNIAYIIIATLFASMGFYFFFRVFKYLQLTPDIGPPLMIRILSIGFLTFFNMLVVSNIITSISTLYSSPEVVYLFSTPLSSKTVFLVKFVENIFFSSWAIMLMGAPIVASYGVAIKTSSYFYPLIILLFIPFIIISSSVGISLSILGTRFLSKLKLKKILSYGIPAILFIAVVILYTIRPRIMMISETENLFEVDRFLANIEFISTPIAPNDWIMKTITAITTQNFSDALFYGALLITTAIVFFMFATWIAEKFYYIGWTNSTENSSSINTKNKTMLNLQKSLMLRAFPQHIRTMIIKDIMLFIRTPEQWAQLLILLILLIIYIVNLKYIPLNFDSYFWSTIVAFLNFGFTGYVLATVSVRFVFPTISMEGHTFWALGSAPVSLKSIFWEKFWISFIISLICAEILMAISSVLLKVNSVIFAISIAGTFLMTVSLTSMNIGLGAIYPYFNEKNPSRIASSAGALIAVIICLVYVGVTVSIIAVPTWVYLNSIYEGYPMPIRYAIIAFLALIVLNFASILIPIKLGLQSLEKQDF